MSWPNLHRWVVRHCDEQLPNIREFNEYSKIEPVEETFTNCGNSVLHLAAAGESTTLLKFLTQKVSKAFINHRNELGETALHWACRQSDLEAVRWLISYGADVKALDYENNTSLFFAVEKGNFQIVEYILKEHQVDINAENTEGQTLLEIACEEYELKVIELLVKHGASIEEMLCKYIKENEPEIVQCLVKAKGKKNISKFNPLHFAVAHDQFHVAKALCEIQTLTTAKDNGGKTP
eukprot:CAMPEP_0206200928 /NCGR_PEP_ID=MMETSP0166-20121206/11202_1 /ASSEMBLY_ACC=CAM_ASM_000260 /TAXON_ID=95228 /ORGANISM="Vannella robusta, Strain DIVA3 518/3/11/1/6" /LENGTH=235 /DNA_ID=CAMNT_0053619421 /DNA_START=129 /DNA_END=833 /DNA_ORIENTATION=-